MSKLSLVTVGPEQDPMLCLMCEASLFADQEIKLNTTGMEFLNLGWANSSGTALICADCGFVHTFAYESFQLWEPDGGYPRPEPGQS